MLVSGLVGMSNWLAGKWSLDEDEMLIELIKEIRMRGVSVKDESDGD